MPLTLHAAFVPSALQMLGTGHHLVDRAAAWCKDTGCSEQTLIDERIHPDMFPFAYQIKSIAVHTAGALRAVADGVFAPDLAEPPAGFTAMHAKLDEAIAEIASFDAETMEGWIGAPMRFEFREYRMDFTAEDFLLSFSQPNFYFHTTTAYDILRQKGVPVGKRDFMGALRLAG